MIREIEPGETFVWWCTDCDYVGTDEFTERGGGGHHLEQLDLGHVFCPGTVVVCKRL